MNVGCFYVLNFILFSYLRESKGLMDACMLLTTLTFQIPKCLALWRKMLMIKWLPFFFFLFSFNKQSWKRKSMFNGGVKMRIVIICFHFVTCMLIWQLEQHLYLILNLAPSITFCYFAFIFNILLEEGFSVGVLF